MDLKKINLSGDEYPLLCTIPLLKDIQDEFGSIPEFSEKLMPSKKEGKKKVLDDTRLPDIRAIELALPRMINDGIRYYNKYHDLEMKPVKADEIFLKNDQPLFGVAMAVYTELWRSINAPKQQPLTETSRA